MNEFAVDLDVTKEPRHGHVLYLGQGDKDGTVLVASMYDNGEELDLTGLDAYFMMRTPGGTDYYQAQGTVSGNVATFTIDETYAAGHVGETDIAYVKITDGSEIVSTSRITVVVLESATEGVEPAPAYVSAIEEFLENAQEEVDEAVAAAQAIVDYSVPLMSASTRGGAKLGGGLAVGADEKLSVSPATTSAVGGVKPDGTTITVDNDGTIHGASTYSLPTMSSTTKGGAKLGSGLSVASDALSVKATTDAQIDSIAGGTSESGAESLSTSGLTRLWSKITAAFAAATHSHAASDITSGEVPVANGGTGATDASTALANLGALPTAGGTVTGALNLTGGLQFNSGTAYPLFVTNAIAGFTAPVAPCFVLDTTDMGLYYEDGN